jgi:hypothetical protein
MYVGLIPDSPAVREAMGSGFIPAPVFETHFAFGLARAVMAAIKLGVFELGGEAATGHRNRKPRLWPAGRRREAQLPKTSAANPVRCTDDAEEWGGNVAE